MSAWDLDLLSRACDVLLPVVDEYEHGYLAILAETGRTSAVNGLRAARLQRVVIAVGMFSVFEAAAKEEYGWADPIVEIGRLLKEADPSLWALFDQYWLANNVLKHGAGPSLDKLVARRGELEFKVRADDEPFFEEGVVNEIHSRIDIDNSFVKRCAEIIEAVSEMIRRKRSDDQ